MGNFRMCDGKVRFSYDRAVVEAWLQGTNYPHWTWHAYDCLWCDFAHVGRARVAAGHSAACQAFCARRAIHDREFRIIEGTW